MVGLLGRRPAISYVGQQANPEEQMCLDAGGTWDPVKKVCVLPGVEGDGQVTTPSSTDQARSDILKRNQFDKELATQRSDAIQQGARGAGQSVHQYVQDNKQTINPDAADPRGGMLGTGAGYHIASPTEEEIRSVNEQVNAPGLKILDAAGNLLPGANILTDMAKEDILTDNPYDYREGESYGDAPAIKEAMDDAGVEIDSNTGNISVAPATSSIPATTMIATFEGYSGTAYEDPPGSGKYSIGYGNQTYPDGAPVKAGDEIDQATGNSMFNNEVTKRRQYVDGFADDHGYNWTEEQRNAMTSFAYNVGSLDQVTANGSRTNEEILAAMLKYVKAGGKVMDGLVARRKSEARSFAVDNTEKLRQDRDKDRNKEREDAHNRAKQIQEDAADAGKSVHEHVQDSGPSTAPVSGSQQHEQNDPNDPRNNNRGGLVYMNRGGGVPMFANDGSMVNHPYDREGEQFDTVPAQLTPGEFVIDADSTHKIEKVAPGLLDTINDWEPSSEDKAAAGTPESMNNKGKSKKLNSGEDIEIKRKFEDGTQIIVKSPAGSRTEVSGLLDSLVGEAEDRGYEPVDKKSGEDDVMLNIGGLLNSRLASGNTGMYNRQRQNARNAAAAQVQGAGLRGGLGALGKNLDTATSRAGAAGFNTGQLGRWGSGGYNPASFSSKALPETSFGSQGERIGQAQQEIGNARADLQGSLANIDRQQFEDQTESQIRQDSKDRQDRDDFERRAEPIRGEIKEYEKGIEKLKLTLELAGRLEQSVRDSGDAWEVFADRARLEAASGLDDVLENLGQGNAGSGEHIQTLLEERALAFVQNNIGKPVKVGQSNAAQEATGTGGRSVTYTQGEANKIGVAIGLLAELATAALAAQGPGVKTNFDFKVAKDTIGQTTRPAPQFISSIQSFAKTVERNLQNSLDKVKELNSEMDNIAKGYGFEPQTTSGGLLGTQETTPAATPTTTAPPPGEEGRNSGGLLGRKWR